MTIKSINETDLKARIPGWGSDLDFAMRPGVPREKTPANGTGAHWTTPEPQFKKVEYLKTVARDELTPVYGTPNPPRLLSGQMRRIAYSMPEGWISRWTTLLLADRIDMVEHIIQDVLTGKAGNPIREMGITIELKEKGKLARPQRRRALLLGGLASLGLALVLAPRIRESVAAKSTGTRAKRSPRTRAA
ncbi:MAG: hypothetical protein ACJ763_13075 [Bdellovibrionia bacterium]